MKWDADVCIYHYPCDDGFACAWIAQKKWSNIILYPTNYGREINVEELRDKNVLIADFSFRQNDLLTLANIARSIVILDHHKTAEAELSDWNHTEEFSCEDLYTTAASGFIITRFDMEQSGCGLTWDFCFPNEPMPVMLQFIEDQDLYTFSLKETRAFTYYLRSYPHTFEIWNQIQDTLEHDANYLMGQAFAIERYHNQLIARILPTATCRQFGNYKNIPVAHAPKEIAADVGHELLKFYPDAPFAAVAVVAYGERTWSLCSEDSREDVSEIAKSYGGGGHRNSAGFRVPT